MVRLLSYQAQKETRPFITLWTAYRGDLRAVCFARVLIPGMGQRTQSDPEGSPPLGQRWPSGSIPVGFSEALSLVTHVPHCTPLCCCPGSDRSKGGKKKMRLC